MKKILSMVALCLVLVGLMAAPVMAAPKTLTFDTGLTSDPARTIDGTLETGFTITTEGDDALLEISLDGEVADPGLRDGMYAFSLKATGSQKADLKSYFAAKEWPFPEYYQQINAQIAGGLPFFYLKADGGSYTLVDGFSYGLGLGETTLRINDDYPEGTYVYKGHLKGSNNALLQLTITLTVERDD